MKISHPTGLLKGVIQLPTSKSISNRLLVLKHLYCPELEIEGLSKANDTQLMNSLIESKADKLNVEDAGTVMRFLLAYMAASKRDVTLKGTARMHQRPIGELVDALGQIGAEIEFLGNEGYPPVKLSASALVDADLDMRKVQSSQFVSAMLMILPSFGLNSHIQIDPKMNSYAFVQMTIDVMDMLGLHLRNENQRISALDRTEPARTIKVERDWSSFYYWFAMAVLAKESELFFPGLKLEGIQTESQWLEVLTHELIFVEQNDEGILLQRKPGDIKFNINDIDLKNHPDLAPSFILLFACLEQECTFTGLESLDIKESERAKVLHSYLDQLGGSLTLKNGKWILQACDVSTLNDNFFQTHKDHRMAMSLACLSLIAPINLDDGKVVSKSYPSFWLEMQHLGFEIDTFA
ncbi:MAG: hypothetical protein JXR19_07985 [Bacteroidia bacterium]